LVTLCWEKEDPKILGFQKEIWLLKEARRKYIKYPILFKDCNKHLSYSLWLESKWPNKSKYKCRKNGNKYVPNNNSSENKPDNR